MDYEAILVSKGGGAGTVTMNRPERLNAHTAQMGREIGQAFRSLDADPEVGAIIFTGAGRAFCSGADMGGFQQRVEERGQGRQAQEQGSGVSFPHLVRGLGKPVIAAINGVAVGLGFTMALCCDIRLAAQSARMSAIFVRRGLTPEAGSSFNLPRLIGVGKAMELVLTGRMVAADEAAAMGLVNHVYPDDRLMPAALEMAQAIAANAPLAVRWSRELLIRGMDSSLDSQLALERHALDRAFATEDHAEAVRAFLGKREARFQGR